MTTPGFNKPAFLVGQFGTPIWGVSGCPLPFTGNYFWVDETNGSDGNTGGPSDPFKTLTQALAGCTSGNSDVIFMVGSVHVTTTVAWNLNKTHLIGLSPPSQNSRARIAIADTTLTTLVSPLVNVTGAGCYFQNIEVFHGNAQATTGEVSWAEAGGQNYYKNCNFIQTGNTINCSLAASRALTIAKDENLFEDCTIGGDTSVRATNANATLEFLTGAARTIFKRCVFQSWVTDASDVQVLIQAGGMDRYAIFEQCTFHNFGTAMTVAITNSGGSPGGNVVLNNCIVIGATAIATSGNVFVNQLSAGGATTSYIGLLAT